MLQQIQKIINIMNKNLIDIININISQYKWY